MPSPTVTSPSTPEFSNQATILDAPIEKPIQMLVGRGITPEIWSAYDLAPKKAMADLFSQYLAEEDSTRHAVAIAENVLLDGVR